MIARRLGRSETLTGRSELTQAASSLGFISAPVRVRLTLRGSVLLAHDLRKRDRSPRCLSLRARRRVDPGLELSERSAKGASCFNRIAFHYRIADRSSSGWLSTSQSRFNSKKPGFYRNVEWERWVTFGARSANPDGAFGAIRLSCGSDEQMARRHDHCYFENRDPLESFPPLSRTR